MLLDYLVRRSTMRMRSIVIAAIFTILLPAAFAQNAAKTSAKQAVKPACDRTCLEGYVDKYLDAMQAHDPSPSLFAKNVKFTENGIRLPFGNEGLWYDMAGRGNYKFYVPDVETQQVAFIGTVLEGGSAPKAKTLAGEVSAKLAAASAKPKPAAKAAEPTLVAFALRLKIVNKLITEVEQLAIRPETSLGGGGARGGAGAATTPSGTGVAVEKMGSPRKIFSEIIPEAERASRDELIKVANYYFTGLARNDGKGVGGTGTYPFTDDCERIENGMVACSPTSKTNCKKQFEDGSLFNIVSRIRDRRFVAVDRERGIVFAFGFFDHEQINWTWQIAELFRIEKGKFRAIEAIFGRAPYGINSGWSSYEKSISEELQNIK
jgi:hypothetical protein